jgi:hypothetical protein
MDDLKSSVENAEFRLTGLNNDKGAFANNDQSECCTVAERAIASYEQLINDVKDYIDNIIPVGGKRKNKKTRKSRKSRK